MSEKPMTHPPPDPLPQPPTREQDKAKMNTDRELWREREDDYYADSIHITEDGGIGINCGGSVYVKSLREWHRLAGGPFSLHKPSSPAAEPTAEAPPREPARDQSEDSNIVKTVTAVVREADAAFTKAGGTSRHWVRDWFLPLLNKAGLIVLDEPKWDAAGPANEAAAVIDRSPLSDGREQAFTIALSAALKYKQSLFDGATLSQNERAIVVRGVAAVFDDLEARLTATIQRLATLNERLVDLTALSDVEGITTLWDMLNDAKARADAATQRLAEQAAEPRCGGSGFIAIPPSSPGPPEGEFCRGCPDCEPSPAVQRRIHTLEQQLAELTKGRDDLAKEVQSRRLDKKVDDMAFDSTNRLYVDEKERAEVAEAKVQQLEAENAALKASCDVVVVERDALQSLNAALRERLIRDLLALVEEQEQAIKP